MHGGAGAAQHAHMYLHACMCGQPLPPQPVLAASKLRIV